MSEQRIVKREYWWGNEKEPRYATEQELKTAHEEACEPDKHSWESTFSFAVYRCINCKAMNERIT